MRIKPGVYRDELSKIQYQLDREVELDNVTLIKGDNGVGKTRFVEGVLLKELRKGKKSIIYFGQDLENQILTYELISIVKDFIERLKEKGNFLKAVLLNDSSDSNLKIDFDSDEILNPSLKYIRKFIKRESVKYKPDIIIFDEVDKYFESRDEFLKVINGATSKNIVIISHLIERSEREINLVKGDSYVKIQ